MEWTRNTEQIVNERTLTVPVTAEESLQGDLVAVTEITTTIGQNIGDGSGVSCSNRSFRFWNVSRSACFVGLVAGLVVSTWLPQVLRWMGGTYSVGAETGASVGSDVVMGVDPNPTGMVTMESPLVSGTVAGTTNTAGTAAVDSDHSTPVTIRPPARNAASTALEYAKTVETSPNAGYTASTGRRTGNAPQASRADASGMGGNVFQIQPAPANTDMIAVSTQLQNPETRESYQQLTLIDTKKKVITVYHIDAALGQVSLQCVRPFRYDQELQSYYHKDYTGNPLMPSEIQRMLEEQN